MARESYIFDQTTLRLIPKGEYYARRPRPARGDFPLPMLQRDYIAPGVCQIDGKTYDSKSKLFEAYREYEARTGQKVMTVGDSDLGDFTREIEQPVDEKAIDASIKTALEMHGA